MEIYLPIAELPINIFALLSIGFVAGLLAGLFGIGGGFIMTPMLIFLGVPPTVAVATSTAQIVASSFSAFLSHLRRKNVDFKMGNVLIMGGLLGSSFGIFLFKALQSIGQIDLVISLSYVFILGTIGLSMAYESTQALAGQGVNKDKKKSHSKLKKLLQKLPYQKYYEQSDLKISVIVPVVISFFTGILVSIMGIGGGFVMIPAMIYIIGMPTSVAIGTSLFQAVIITSNVTILHAINTQTVDIILGGILLTTSVIGAQIGSHLGIRISAERLRFLLSIIVLAVVFKLSANFIIEPESVFQISPI